MNQAERYRILRRCSRLCLWLNVFLMLLKIGYGHIYLSRALFADGVHSLLDVSADIFVLYAIAIANRPEDDRHPYGYFRYETLANIVISLMLLFAAGAIVYDAVLAWDLPVVTLEWPVGMVAVISIVLNELSYQYVSRHAKVLGSDLLLTTAVHQRADAATSFVVLGAAGCSMYGFMHADIVGAIVISIMIAYYAFPAFMKSIRELLDRGLDTEQLEKIREAINSVPGVLDHHLLRTRSMADKGYVDVHVVVSPYISVSEGHYIGDAVERALLAYPVLKDVTVHIDAEDDRADAVISPDRSSITRWLADEGILVDRLVIHYLSGAVELDLYITGEIPNITNVPKWLKLYHFYKKVD